MQRRLTIRSNPPGALVYVDDHELGITPVSHDFIYYGTRKVRLVKDGYETLTLLQPIPAPWYQFIGLDFITENVIPGEIRDERVLDYQLSPQIIVPTEQLLGRAENLRHSSVPPPMPPAPPPRHSWWPRFLTFGGPKPPATELQPLTGTNGAGGEVPSSFESGAMSLNNPAVPPQGVQGYSPPVNSLPPLVPPPGGQPAYPSTY